MINCGNPKLVNGISVRFVIKHFMYGLPTPIQVLLIQITIYGNCDKLRPDLHCAGPPGTFGISLHFSSKSENKKNLRPDVPSIFLPKKGRIVQARAPGTVSLCHTVNPALS